ncbi:HNH endonuclease [Aurantimonas sp. A2-1-M11]|uniref:HNH endonuclease n=1 Tax=Aurantimonas sp. A2-1-M11 TaxID=3113712 RepID=UPI002F95071F
MHGLDEIGGGRPRSIADIRHAEANVKRLVGLCDKKDLILATYSLTRYGFIYGATLFHEHFENATSINCHDFVRVGFHIYAYFEISQYCLTSAGRVGLTRGNKDEAVVWAEFANSPKRLEAIAAAIRAAVVHADGAELAPIALGEDSEATEGRLLTVLHTRRERNRALVQKRKEAALKATGRLQCEACDFDFHERYGERGDGFIEVHHTQPLHTLAEETKTRLEDLALVCANCHRMIHRTRHWLSIAELRSVLGGASSC